MKRAALYLRVNTVDQHPETQLYDLRQMAALRGVIHDIHKHVVAVSKALQKHPS